MLRAEIDHVEEVRTQLSSFCKPLNIFKSNIEPLNKDIKCTAHCYDSRR